MKLVSADLPGFRYRDLLLKQQQTTSTRRTTCTTRAGSATRPVTATHQEGGGRTATTTVFRVFNFSQVSKLRYVVSWCGWAKPSTGTLGQLLLFLPPWTARDFDDDDDDDDDGKFSRHVRNIVACQLAAAAGGVGSDPPGTSD